MLRVLGEHVHLVRRGGRARRASRRGADPHDEARGHQLGHRARGGGHDLTERVDDRAEHEWRPAADNVDQVADRQVAQELGHLRQRHQQTDAQLAEADRLRTYV